LKEWIWKFLRMKVIKGRFIIRKRVDAEEEIGMIVHPNRQL
jgi:hypothetical protein